MHQDYVQRVRYKLQKRFRRLSAADEVNVYPELLYLWRYISGEELIRGIVDRLVAEELPHLETEMLTESGDVRGLYGESEKEQAGIGLLLLRRWVSHAKKDIWHYDVMSFNDLPNFSDAAELARRVILQPLVDYLDESVDDSRAVLSYLVRFKHRAEWFDREMLLRKYQENTGRGEVVLAKHLYRYLHDQGLDIVIEPQSASGVPDFLSQSLISGAFVADVKLFKDGTASTYLVSAYNQIYTYLRDLNEAMGYLVVFRTVDVDVSFDVGGVGTAAPFLTHNGKTVFFVVIDICDYEQPASKRGKARTVVLREAQLIEKVTD